MRMHDEVLPPCRPTAGAGLEQFNFADPSLYAFIWAARSEASGLPAVPPAVCVPPRPG